MHLSNDCCNGCLHHLCGSVCVCLFVEELLLVGIAAGWSLRVFVQVRSGCAFMVHVCQDEHQLYHEFFSKPTPKLEWVAPTSLFTREYDHWTHREPLSFVWHASRMYLLKVWHHKFIIFQFAWKLFEMPFYTAWLDNLYHYLKEKTFFNSVHNYF